MTQSVKFSENSKIKEVKMVRPIDFLQWIGNNR